MTTTADATNPVGTPVGSDLVKEEDRVDAHNVRSPKARWDKFGRRVQVLSNTRTSVLNAFMAWYNYEPGAQLPARPARGVENKPRDQED